MKNASEFKKIKVLNDLTSIDLFDKDESIDEFIKTLELAKKSGVTHIQFDYETGYDGLDQAWLNTYSFRQETNKEKANREEVFRVSLANQERYERKNFERLQAKYGNTNSKVTTS